MNSMLIVSFVELGLCINFFYRIFRKKEKTATNGFGAALFLIAFWMSFSPFLAKWFKAIL